MTKRERTDPRGGCSRPFPSLEEACRALKIEGCGELSPGRWYRVDAVDGESVYRGAGRVFLFPDGAGGIVWNYRTGERAVFFADGARPSEAELMRRRRMAAEAVERLVSVRRREKGVAARFGELLEGSNEQTKETK